MAIDPLLSTFRRANDPTTAGDAPLSGIVACIRGSELAERCAAIRARYAEAGGGQAGKDAIRPLKVALPGITLAGTFARRAKDAWRTASGLVGIDIDGLVGAKFDEVWAVLAAAPWVALLYRSPSGQGIKGAVRVPGLDAPDHEAYALAWQAVTLWLASLGLDNDQAVKDASRLAFLAHDPDAYHNHEADPFDLYRWRPPPPVDPQPVTLGGVLRPGDDFNRRQNIAELLALHGWRLLRDGENQHWCRPGKEHGTSATLRDRVFYCFSSNAPPFEANRAYSPFAVFALLEHGGDFARAASALREHGYGAPNPVLTCDTEDAIAEPDPPDPGPVPESLLHMPGFVGDVMDHCLATAPYPNPVLAFCGAVTLLGTLAGRKVRDEADNRTNLYLLGLANSGAGKDHPRKLNQRIMLEAGRAGQVGDSFASAEGIEDRMLLEPCMLFQTDEIDALLLAIREGKDGRSERIMQVLLKFYSSSNGIYPMRVKAGKEPEFIDQPCLTLFGTAIPQHLYESLSAKMLSNGFFARMLILESGPRGSGQEPGCEPVPEAIRAVASWWADFRPEGPHNLSRLHPQPAVVPATAGARERQRSIRSQADEQYAAYEVKADQMGMALWARVAEKARRLALLHACSENHQEPIITEAGTEWAWRLVAHQTEHMVAMARLHVYEGDFDQKQKKAIQAIRDRGGSIRQEQLTKVLRALPARERDEVIGNLVITRQIEVLTEQTGGRPRTVYRIPGLSGKSPEGR